MKYAIIPSKNIARYNNIDRAMDAARDISERNHCDVCVCKIVGTYVSKVEWQEDEERDDNILARFARCNLWR
jgi:hypothetical protein